MSEKVKVKSEKLWRPEAGEFYKQTKIGAWKNAPDTFNFPSGHL
jgi:hypothetical protein